MNRWDAVNEIQKHAQKFRGLIYLFEEYTKQDQDYGTDEVKSVRFYLPLTISLFFSHGPAISAGRQNEVDFDIVDVGELEFKSSGEEWGAWSPRFMPVYTVACVQKGEIKEALENLRRSRELLESYLHDIDSYLFRRRP